MTVVDRMKSASVDLPSRAYSGMDVGPEAWTSIAPVARAVECSLGGAQSSPTQREAIVSSMVASWRDGRRMPLDLVRAGLAGAGA